MRSRQLRTIQMLMIGMTTMTAVSYGGFSYFHRSASSSVPLHEGPPEEADSSAPADQSAPAEKWKITINDTRSRVVEVTNKPKEKSKSASATLKLNPTKHSDSAGTDPDETSKTASEQSSSEGTSEKKTDKEGFVVVISPVKSSPYSVRFQTPQSSATPRSPKPTASKSRNTKPPTNSSGSLRQSPDS